MKPDFTLDALLLKLNTAFTSVTRISAAITAIRIDDRALEENSAWGVYDNETGEVIVASSLIALLRDGLRGNNKAQCKNITHACIVLLHETFHAIVQRIGIPASKNPEFDDYLEEGAVQLATLRFIKPFMGALGMNTELLRQGVQLDCSNASYPYSTALAAEVAAAYAKRHHASLPTATLLLVQSGMSAAWLEAALAKHELFPQRRMTIPADHEWVTDLYRRKDYPKLRPEVTRSAKRYGTEMAIRLLAHKADLRDLERGIGTPSSSLLIPGQGAQISSYALE